MDRLRFLMGSTAKGKFWIILAMFICSSSLYSRPRVPISLISLNSTLFTYNMPPLCNTVPSKLFNLTKRVPLKRKELKIFNLCILDETPLLKPSPYILVVDSVCPLGIAVVDELKKRGIRHLDVRGAAHLNLATKEGLEVLSQFTISKSLFVCDSNQSREYKPDREIVISAVKGIDGDVNINFPKVFGHLRNSKKIPLFSKCQNGEKIDVINSKEELVLAEDAAKAIVDKVRFNTFKQVKHYTLKEISQRFKAYCNDHKPDILIETLLNKSKPFPPQGGKELTLSIVGATTLGKRFAERVNKTLALYNLYLKDYPLLPLEIIVVFVDDGSTIPFDPFPILQDKPFLKNYIRPIIIDNSKYQKIFQKHHLVTFSEFVFKNIGIRRARGEFIMAVSLDSVAPKLILEYVLHHQFTQHTYMKSNRIERDINTPLDELNDYFPDAFVQRFVKSTFWKEWPDEFIMDGSGDGQLAHWTAWKNIKGYKETSAVFHVDTITVMEFFLQQPNFLFSKFMENNVHWSHPKTSASTQHAYFWNASYSDVLNSGYLPADFGEKRDDWGERNDPDFPPVIF